MPTRILKRVLILFYSLELYLEELMLLRNESMQQVQRKDLIKCAAPTANPATKQNIINSLNFACSLKYMQPKE